MQAQDSGTDVSVLLLGQLSELQHQLENRAVHEMERQQGRHPQRGESQSCACVQLGTVPAGHCPCCRCWTLSLLTLLPAFAGGCGEAVPRRAGEVPDV